MEMMIMCLIIETKKEFDIPDSFFHEVFRKNDDGFGIMYIKDNVIHQEKFAGAPIETLIDKYQKTREYEPYIHMRMRTHGKINVENSHPYDCGHDTWLMHNGIISNVASQNSEMSDTWHFIKDILRPLLDEAKDPHMIVFEPFFEEIIGKFIGYNNRLVIGNPLGFTKVNGHTWFKIPDTPDKLMGMQVSNSYAWDVMYNTPKVKYPFHAHHYQKPFDYYTRGSQYKEPYSYQSDKEYVKYTQEGLTQLDEDLYVDQRGEIWDYDGVKWWRLKTVPVLSKRKQKKVAKIKNQRKDKQQQQMICLPEVVTKKEEEVVGDVKLIGPDEATEIMYDLLSSEVYNQAHKYE